MGWINDPNGLVYFHGEYHLFYQHYPDSPSWGPMHWGHAVSRDLVHWEHLPIALYPDELGAIFSGSAVVDRCDSSGFFGGRPGLVAVFTHAGKHGQVQSIAFSRDRGRTWTKYAGNPVIDAFCSEDFRDPKVFWHEPSGAWVMVVAGGKVRIYRSHNLIDWSFSSDNELWTECPDLFPLTVDGDPKEVKWVLSMAGRGYCVGDFDGWRFVPETGVLPMNCGPDAYAAQTFNDEPDGRRILINWMNDWKYANDLRQLTGPWSGVMSFPYELALCRTDSGLRLVQRPVAELETLRIDRFSAGDVPLEPGCNPLVGVRGTQLEVIVEAEVESAREFGLKVRKGAGEETVVGYDAGTRTFFVDRSRSGKMLSGRFEAPRTSQGERVKLRVLVDACSVEVFGDDGMVVLTSLIFPQPESDGLELYAAGGRVNLVSVDVYWLAPVLQAAAGVERQ